MACEGVCSWLLLTVLPGLPWLNDAVLDLIGQLWEKGAGFGDWRIEERGRHKNKSKKKKKRKGEVREVCQRGGGSHVFCVHN